VHRFQALAAAGVVELVGVKAWGRVRGLLGAEDELLNTKSRLELCNGELAVFYLRGCEREEPERARQCKSRNLNP
jgi:hypothetical protein